MKNRKQPVGHVLRGSKSLAIAVALCAFEGAGALTGILGAPAGRDPLMIFGFSASIIICTSIAIRTDESADRVVFGPAAVAFALYDVAQIFTPRAETGVIINMAASILWLAAAAGAAVVLIRRELLRARDAGNG